MASGYSRSPFRRPCLLLVDDTPANIEVLVGLLKSDFDLKVATRGAKALEICESDLPIDLILLDVMMPGMDGPGVLAELRKLPNTADTPVIFMTAKVQSSEVAYFKSLGALGVIAKPFDPMQLSQQVRDMWEQGTA